MVCQASSGVLLRAGGPQWRSMWMTEYIEI